MLEEEGRVWVGPIARRYILAQATGKWLDGIRWCGNFD